MARADRCTKSYVAVVAVLACAMLAFVAATSPIGVPHVVAAFGVALAIAQLLPIPIRRGSEIEMVGFEEAVLLPMLLVLPAGGGMVALVAAIAAWQLVARQPFEKATFNAAQLVVSFGSAQLVVLAIAGDSPGTTPEGIAAAVGGICTMFVVNQLLVAGVLARALGAPLLFTLRDDLSTKLGIIAANICFGVLLVPAIQTHPETLVAAGVLFLFMHAACRAFLREAHGDDAMAGLISATDRLGDDLPVVSIAEHVARVACDLDGACGAMVRLFAAEFDGGSELVSARAEATSDGELEFQTGVRGRLAAVMQLERSGQRIGELRVWRDPTQVGRSRAQRHRDRAMLEVLARHASVALAKATIAQAAARELQTMAQVFEHANEGLVVLDHDGRVLACNPAMARLVGIAADRIVGTPIAAISMELARALDGGDAGVIDAPVSNAHGDQRVVRASYAPIGSAGTNADGRWVLALHDTTKLHEVERLKRDFVATVSHELRTPLTTIRGFLETMRREDLVLEPSQTVAFLDIMRGEAVRLDRLINDLLDTSAIEAGRPPSVRICTVDLVDEVRRAVTSFRVARPDVDVLYPDDLHEAVVVRVDPDRLQQVLTNLLENARRHGGSDRPIEVRIRPERLGRAAVMIRDHGRGIGVEDQSRIFERFFFTADSATRTGGGAGLGLYICQRLMQAMDGVIDVHSIPGAGATFTIQLPGVARSAPRRRFPARASVVQAVD